MVSLIFGSYPTHVCSSDILASFVQQEEKEIFIYSLFLALTEFTNAGIGFYFSLLFICGHTI